MQIGACRLRLLGKLEFGAAGLSTAGSQDTNREIELPLDRQKSILYFPNRLISQVGKYMPDHLSTTFAALSDPTRRAILARLALGETSVKELAEPFSITAPSITKHLKVLERAGLITRSRDAQWRPCRLEAAPLREVSDWVKNYRRFWERSMNQAR